MRRIIILLILAAGCILQPVFADNYARVAIIQNANSLSLKILGEFIISDISGKNTFYKGRGLRSTVTTFPGGISLAGRSFKEDKLLIKSWDPDTVIINGNTFRGDVSLIRDNKGNLTAVNKIALEDYIRGILYNEASHYWPMEALKAQAIVSRTYAVYQMQENAGRDFDLTNDTYSQVYGGSASERFRTDKAVEETKGLILTYQGKAIPAYFHATCAGHTEDASLVWKTDLPPLKGVPCDFCKESPHYNWHYVIFIGELRELLKKAGYDLGMIKQIQILGNDNSGRVTDLNIVSERNEFKIASKDLRNIVGANLLRSTRFTVTIEGDDAIFEGTGWGHGVGLCQWGAYFMSKQGWEAKKILQYYYPGTDVKAL
ncbi:MAG TPA: SpoIID/LytB domain-containing protein [Candidatus Margulisiibacteriota bacterium]|nr:SpoIID/LytB domain-containing protein [Candidatus Margulisiibacteriota bacterium]